MNMNYIGTQNLEMETQYRNMKTSNDNNAIDRKQQLVPYLFFWKKLYLSKGKLKATSTTSSVLAGFAMVAMVEINIDQSVPVGLLIIFSLLTTLLISVHIFALMISVCILPNIETVDQLNKSSYIHEELGIKISPAESPHNKLKKYIEMAWIFSTGLGTLLFLIELPVCMWIKFYNISQSAAFVSTGVMIPICILFLIFAVRFYRSLVDHKHDRSTKEIEELQNLASQLNKTNHIGEDPKF